jgi:aspartyl-tRNA synthetase
MKRSHHCNDLSLAHTAQIVCLNGWVSRVRDTGTLFIVLRDRTGIVQITVDSSNPCFETAKSVKSEYVLEVVGVVQERAAQNKTESYSTGAIEVIPSSLTILNRAKPVPFHVDGTPITASEEVRLKYRYLDLRREPMREALRLRHKVITSIYSFLDSEGFISVETPMLTKSTPEGARDYLVPSRSSKGQFYALPQSPQLFKQLLMIANFDKYFQIARCFRDEDLRADRQPDFTQLDIEMSFVDVDDVLELNERLIQAVFRQTLDLEIPIPLPRLTYADAINRFGSDKPDQRFGVEIQNVSGAVANSGFAVFKSALETGGTVRVLVAPAELTRKQIEALEQVAKQHGAKGLAWTKVVADSKSQTADSNHSHLPSVICEGGIAKFLTPTEMTALLEQTAAVAGQTLLFGADSTDTALKALGAVRLALRDELNLISTESPRFHFSWVVDFPLLEWDEENGRFTFMHHPFTSPALEDIAKFGTAEMGSMKARAYDLVLNGYEVGGGSIRIHNPDVQEQMFNAIGFSTQEARERFGFFMEALEYGTPPHGGIAWGLDRMVAVMAGAETIRDVIAFPKNARGADIMADAPSSVDEKQLNDLHIAVK